MIKYVILIICIAFFAIASVDYLVTENNQSAQLEAQSVEITDLQNRLATLEAAYNNKQSELIMNVTGLDMRRINKDKTVAEKFLDIVCTWDSYEEYMAAREKVMDKYDIAEDSAFMTVFMPVVGNKTAPNGMNYNQIDTNGLNMHYEDVAPYVTRIRSGDYSYFSIVAIGSTWDNGGETIVHVAITYTVDSDGNIFDIAAIPLST